MPLFFAPNVGMAWGLLMQWACQLEACMIHAKGGGTILDLPTCGVDPPWHPQGWSDTSTNLKLTPMCLSYSYHNISHSSARLTSRTALRSRRG